MKWGGGRGRVEKGWSQRRQGMFQQNKEIESREKYEPKIYLLTSQRPILL